MVVGRPIAAALQRRVAGWPAIPDGSLAARPMRARPEIDAEHAPPRPASPDGGAHRRVEEPERVVDRRRRSGRRPTATSACLPVPPPSALRRVARDVGGRRARRRRGPCSPRPRSRPWRRRAPRPTQRDDARSPSASRVATASWRSSSGASPSRRTTTTPSTARRPPASPPRRPPARARSAASSSCSAFTCSSEPLDPVGDLGRRDLAACRRGRAAAPLRRRCARARRRR